MRGGQSRLIQHVRQKGIEGGRKEDERGIFGINHQHERGRDL